ncbi:Transposase IS4 [Popillia japonica]|uniref:Transposase IS4 n=1 Tax=Popillia japonica TaxID=7064 RepID=A0AAW1HRX1_POPJA
MNYLNCKICEWQKEQDRLLSLWQEYEADEPFIDEADSQEEDEIHHVSCNSDDSDQEQEAQVEEEGHMREQLQEMEEDEEEVRENNFLSEKMVQDGLRYHHIKIKICEWQKEQDRLLSLWQEYEADEPFIDEADSQEEDEIHHVSCNSDYSDQEQEAEVEEEGHMREQLQEMEEDEEELLIDEQMTDVMNTKHRIAEKPEKWTAVEIKALLGLLYLSGVLKNNRRSSHELWGTNGIGIEIFRCTMSQRRFGFLISCLRFDNKANRQERRIDKLTAFLEKFLENCKDADTPSEYKVNISDD